MDFPFDYPSNDVSLKILQSAYPVMNLLISRFSLIISW